MQEKPQSVRRPHRAPWNFLRGALVILLFFGALSAFAGAVMAIAFNGAGMPLASLEGSPFHSFLGPGLILGVVVGGTQLTAALSIAGHRRWALPAAAAAGFGLLIWIFVELAIIRSYSFLQALYFGLGVGELIFVLLVLGIIPGTSSVSRPPKVFDHP
ncbi:hypothetical protein [Specibacter sp. RAF43]|uniref:hypothetical protein n=1 Tax=Specibacter sp. RAF43 TaxID=3233057 RepID=UPI003F9C9AAF